MRKFFLSVFDKRLSTAATIFRNWTYCRVSILRIFSTYNKSFLCITGATLSPWNLSHKGTCKKTVVERNREQKTNVSLWTKMSQNDTRACEFAFKF